MHSARPGRTRASVSLVATVITFAVIGAVLLGLSGGSTRSAGSQSVDPPVASATTGSPVTAPSTSVEPTVPSSAGSSPSQGKETVVPAADPMWIEVRRPDGSIILKKPMGTVDGQVGSGIDPKVWNRADLWAQSVQPQAPSWSTSVIYGHSCIHHVCSFTDLHLARPGDLVILTTPKGVFTYLIYSVQHQPKDGMAHFSFGNADVGLVTCILPGEGSEDDNRVVLGTLIHAVASGGTGMASAAYAHKALHAFAPRPRPKQVCVTNACSPPGKRTASDMSYTPYFTPLRVHNFCVQLMCKTGGHPASALL